MLLSYNVGNANHNSSEKETKKMYTVHSNEPVDADSNLVNPKQAPTSLQGFTANGQDLCQIFINEILIEKLKIKDSEMPRNENSIEIENAMAKLKQKENNNLKDLIKKSPSSNEYNFSGNEEDLIQQDVLNMLNCSIKMYRSRDVTSDSREGDDKKSGNELETPASLFSSKQNKFKDPEAEDTKIKNSDRNKSSMKDEKIISISFEGSMLSDASKESKNFIPKASLFKESTGTNVSSNVPHIKKGKDGVKKPTLASYYKDLFPVKRFESDNSLGERQTLDQNLINLRREELKAKEKNNKEQIEIEKSSKLIKDSSTAITETNLNLNVDHVSIKNPQNLTKNEGKSIDKTFTNAKSSFLPSNIFTSWTSNVLPSNYNNSSSEVDPVHAQNRQEQKNFHNLNPSFCKSCIIKEEAHEPCASQLSRCNTNNAKKYPSNPSIQSLMELETEDVIKYCHIICKDQAGCRLLQKMIDSNPSLVNDSIFYSIYDTILELMYNSFANYFVQKVIDHISEDKLIQTMKLISADFKSLCLDCHGTRVIQKILEKIKNESLLQYFTELLTPHMLEFINDPNANHILIKYISTVPYPKNNVIFEFLTFNIINVATHKHSCCALQKCLQAANPSQRDEIFKLLAQKALTLITDPFGNYVIQFVVTFGDYSINNKIAHAFLSNLEYLSRQKFSSNVIEKCFNYCDDETKLMLVKELCNPMIIPELLFDMYGNYVLQKALACAVEPFYSMFITAIGPHLERLKTFSFGCKLQLKLLTCYPELNNFVSLKKENSECQPKCGNKCGKKGKKKGKKGKMAQPMPMSMYQQNRAMNINQFMNSNNYYTGIPYQPNISQYNMMMNFCQYPFFNAPQLGQRHLQGQGDLFFK